MSKYAKDNETVCVECNSQLGRFDISETTYVSIKSLTFIGCGGNRVFQVTQLIIADSTFQEVQEKSTVLEINDVNMTNIVRSQFLYYTLEHYDSKSGQDLLNLVHLGLDAVLDYIYYMPNTSSGVLYMAFSNVSVVSCRFMYNRADIGGALVAHNSSVHIDKTTLSYNTANFGGTMVTSGSTIHIDNSFFSHNLARVIGGVMVTYNDMVSINSSAFSENNSDRYGGIVFSFGDSSFNITNSNFTSNSATYRGGAIAIYGDSSFNIRNSNFTSNSADTGGVMYTSSDSSFTISNSNFTSNNATFAGGVMATGDSSIPSVIVISLPILLIQVVSWPHLVAL